MITNMINCSCPYEKRVQLGYLEINDNDIDAWSGFTTKMIPEIV